MPFIKIKKIARGEDGSIQSGSVAIVDIVYDENIPRYHAKHSSGTPWQGSLSGAKSNLFRGGFQNFRGARRDALPNGINFQNLWHSRFDTGYFYILLSEGCRLVYRLIGRSPS